MKVGILLLLLCLAAYVVIVAGQYVPYDVEKAKEDVDHGTSLRGAAKNHGVPRRTLQCHIAGTMSTEAIGTVPNRHLSPEQEEDLRSYTLWMSQRGWPLTTKLVQ